MISRDEIITTLSDIRFYYANIKNFQNASKYVGENIKYNSQNDGKV